MSLLAIDPGPTRSAWVRYYDGRPYSFGIDDNLVVCHEVVASPAYEEFAIEMIASYGMAVGAEVFETCVWIGRFLQRWDDAHTDDWEDTLAPAYRVYRRDVKLHLCGSARAKDANIRRALIDRYGPGKDAAIGRKASPGPLYGVTSHVWSALAVAVTAAAVREAENPRAA